MLPSILEIYKLVKKVSSDPLQREAALNLAYQLLDPIVPAALSKVLAANEDFLDENNSFKDHLSYGVVDGCLEYRIEAERGRIAKKIFRQLDNVIIQTSNLETILDLAQDVSGNYWRLYRGYIAAEELSSDREIRDIELGALVEELIKTFAEQEKLFTLLLHYRLNLAQSYVAKNRLINRAVKAANTALANPPLDKNQVVIIEDNVIAFTLENYNDVNFVNVASKIDQYLENTVRKN